LSTAALVKVLSLHYELGQLGNAVHDSTRFLRCQVFKLPAEASTVEIVASKDMR
jgi:hypothetical protein